jgi:mono/diheme cytochrome c family protein
MRPQDLAQPLQINFELPSEAAIPQARPVKDIDTENDPAWIFRYAETGTEFRSGIPYWIFRIMPKIFEDEFEGKGYEHFGFTEDDQSYYGSRPIPRGMSLSDSELRSPLLKVKFSLKRVSINCSGCHRGEYLDAKGQRVLQDGMPNHTADLQAFKRFYASAFQDPRFQAERVVEEIDNALAEEGHGPLISREQLLYRGLVGLLKEMTKTRDSAWMDPPRADNGPGRIDPFNAVKFEVLHVPDDGTVATLDFPSVWNQGPAHRKWHHADGNTDENSARNYGSVIGVGGVPSSVNKKNVSKVGAWFDEFPPPMYPFTPPDPAAAARGAATYGKACGSCHGFYDRGSNSMRDKDKAPMFMQLDLKIGTDPERWKAFLPGTAAALNGYGAAHNLWKRDSFRGSADPGGYLCGPLDGIWARAPYLHNGSVPNIAELLKAPDERVKTFYRANRNYDPVSLGWVHDQAKEGDRQLFLYDTTLKGNSNAGHPYTVDVAERADLIEYLKTL